MTQLPWKTPRKTMQYFGPRFSYSYFYPVLPPYNDEEGVPASTGPAERREVRGALENQGTPGNIPDC